MGQSASVARSIHQHHQHHHHHTQATAFWKPNKADPTPPDPPNSTSSRDVVFSPPDLTRDFTDGIPDECLALIFHSLGSGDRKRCSLVCRRWLSVESNSRHRLSLDARAALLDAVPGLFSRFDSVAKLSLKCERRSDSIGDEALALISQKCPLLTRLKLRACRQISDVGMSVLANNCKNLKKLSCGSSTFGAKGISVVVSSCPLLEELSIKRLRGLTDESDLIVPPKSSSLKSICLKEIFNGQFFGPLIAESPKLKTLKLFRCSGDWDRLLEDITWKVPGLVEVHLEKIQVSDRGLCAFTSCLELEIFHLVKTPDCTDAGISSVARKCKLLRKIHIDGWKSNRIGDEGLCTVARNCRNVQELVLIGVNPTLLSVGLIAENCKNLERLALCGSDTIGDAEISCIASKCVSLKKLCIKSCQISNQGMEALGTGCPNLVKVKVKKCRRVTIEVADWLRSSREGLAVNLDVESPALVEQVDASTSESGLQENVDDQFPVMVEENNPSDIPSRTNSMSVLSKARLRFKSGRNFLAKTLRKLSYYN
ncbi:F-box family protein [Zostera marina]|uniref:F-box family protein n=1 Tax=Zostera marina TaxID=29655 RepID=A0A0K9PXS5_ZOSMR|nr:F-box family protein [Zostera marina]